MVMPLCGTFHYAGVVPEPSLRHAGAWTLADVSGADALPPVRPARARRALSTEPGFEPLRDNRLVGLQPSVQIRDGQLVLVAATPHRAQVRSASMTLDRELLTALHTGDRIELCRTGTADVGVSVLREGVLLWAVGAVTAISLGDSVQVQGGPKLSLADIDRTSFPTTWVDVSIAGQTVRLYDGDEAALAGYRMTLVTAYKFTIPGQYARAALSWDGAGLHVPALRATTNLANEFAMERW